MKKILMLTVTTVFISAAVIAQNKISFGLRLGYSLHTINGKDTDGDKLDNALEDGFNGGVNVEIPIGVDFYLQPGVMYVRKGANLKNYEYFGEVFTGGDVKLAYIEVPVNLLYKPLLGTGRFLLGFGPYVAFGIGREAIVDQGEFNVEFKNDITTTDLNTTPFWYKPVDAGANIFAGYEFNNKLSFQLNTQLGLIKMNPTLNGSETGDASHKNTGFGISLGYRF